MTEHEETGAKLSSYLDNALGAQEKEAVRMHLGRCGSCRGALADLEWAAEQLKRLPEVEPPPWLMPQIMGRVRETALPPVSERFLVPFRVKVLLVLALLAIAGLSFIYQGWTGKKALPPAVVPQARVKPPAPVAAIPPATAGGRVARTPQTRTTSPSIPALYNPPSSVPSSTALPPATKPKAEPAAIPAPIQETPELQSADEWIIPNRDR